jgi:hypothetical protein
MGKREQGKGKGGGGKIPQAVSEDEDEGSGASTGTAGAAEQPGGAEDMSKGKGAGGKGKETRAARGEERTAQKKDATPVREGQRRAGETDVQKLRAQLGMRGSAEGSSLDGVTPPRRNEGRECKSKMAG